MHLVIPLTTLTGADDSPVELTGYGPLPPAMARTLAADGVWKRLITDPLSGALLDHGRHTYRPPAALAEFLHARDQHCRVPICRRRALDSQLDHTIGYHTDHGTTDQQNLYHACLCHHRMKDAPGWSVTQHRDGRLTWTTPTGHRYSSRPFDYRPEPDLVAAIAALDQAAREPSSRSQGRHRSGSRLSSIRFTVQPTHGARRPRRPATVLTIRSSGRPRAPHHPNPAQARLDQRRRDGREPRAVGGVRSRPATASAMTGSRLATLTIAELRRLFNLGTRTDHDIEHHCTGSSGDNATRHEPDGSTTEPDSDENNYHDQLRSAAAVLDQLQRHRWIMPGWLERWSGRSTAVSTISGTHTASLTCRVTPQSHEIDKPTYRRSSWIQGSIEQNISPSSGLLGRSAQAAIIT